MAKRKVAAEKSIDTVDVQNPTNSTMENENGKDNIIQVGNISEKSEKETTNASAATKNTEKNADNRFSTDMTKTFIDAVSKGVAPWQNELNVNGKTSLKDFGAFNPVSGAKYKGFNLVYLKTKQAELESDDPRWVTAKHCESAGWECISDKKSKTCITYYNTETGIYQYNGVYNGKELKNITPLNPELVVNLKKSEAHDIHYVAPNKTTKELLIQEVSRYMSASANGLEFKPSKELTMENTIAYLKESPPTEMFYICNKAYGATKEKQIEKSVSNEQSMESKPYAQKRNDGVER